MEQHKNCVLIVESDSESLKHIIELLHVNPLVSDIDIAVDSDQALLKIISKSPDIVFMEYPTKGKSGNELIRYIMAKLTETTIVFVSRTKEYAANAIHNGVFNYLLKPVSKEQLKKVLENIRLIKQTSNQARINEIIEKNQEEIRFKFQTTKGYVIVAPEEILFCKADGFYTELQLTGNRVELSYLFLSQLEEMLQKFNFLRASRTYLINLKYIRKIHRATNTIILSFNGEEFEVKGSKPQIRNLCKFDA